MKRIYATLLLLGAFCLKSQAQNIDIEAFAILGYSADSLAGQKLCLGKNFSPRANPTGDSIPGIYGLSFNGPDGMADGDKVTFRSSFNNFLTQAECDAQNPPVPLSDRYAWYSILTVNQAAIDNNGIAYSYDKVDSIGMLVDWNRWQQYGPDSVMVYGPPHENFQTGQIYGFFVRTWGMGESANAIVNTDPNMGNNWSVVKIKWNDCAGGVGIGELLVPRDKVNITVFPNPADNQISVTHKSEQNFNGEIYIRDIAGRVVKTKKLGHILAGEHTYSVDVSGLTSGVYTFELNGGDFVGVTKFSKK